MSSIREFQILVSCVTGGIVSLLSTGLTDRDFWIISISSHCVLIAITFWIYREKTLDLDTRTGQFNAFTLALICSISVLLLFALGAYVPIALIFTGRALLTSFVATSVYAYFRTIDSL